MVCPNMIILCPTTMLVSWYFFESGHMIFAWYFQAVHNIPWYYLCKNMVIPWYIALSMALNEHVYGICKVLSGATKHGFTMVLVLKLGNTMVLCYISLL